MKAAVAWVAGTGHSIAAWWNRPESHALVVVQAGQALVTSPDLNLRKSPHPKATLLRALHQDEKVTVLDQTGKWWKVEDSSGSVGWALGRHLEMR